MDNNNNNNSNKNTNSNANNTNNTNNNSLKNKIKNKFNTYKFSLPVFFVIIVIVGFIIIVLSGNFEKSDSLGPYSSKFSRILILLIFIYFIIKIVMKKKISSKKTDFLGFFKIERGLLIYLFIVLLIALLL